MLATLCAALAALAPSYASGLTVSGLRCEFLSNPIGIDIERPRFGWVIDPSEPGARQSACQVRAATSRHRLQSGRPDLWDSGKVASADSLLTPYGGRPLRCGEFAWWQVRVWDGRGKPGPWSAPAFWSKGPSSPGDWKAKWIAAPAGGSRLPVFRREFRLAGQVARATVFVCGLGHYELRLNGQKVGRREIDPGWTNYRQRCLYSAFDVTDRIRTGNNAFGVFLGNGMFDVGGVRYTKFTGSFGQPQLILQMRIEYRNGTSETLGTDSRWRVSGGPITFSHAYGGEDYDARLEEPGWDRPGFRLSSPWRPAELCPGPGGKLCAQMAEPVVVRKTLAPVSWKQVGDVWVADFGQNMSGWPRLRIRGQSGQAVRLIPGEMLKGGIVDQGQSGGPSYWQYTLRGTASPSAEGWGGASGRITAPQPPPESRGSEEWRPRFTYYGFRWLQVEGAAPAGKAAPGQPEIVDLVAEVLYPDVREAGTFECSDPLVNRIHDLIRWAMLSNMKSVLTDCPHREKLGWLEQAHLCGPSLMYNYGLAALYRKIAADMREAQTLNGLVPDIAPEYTVFQGGFRDSPEWGSASIIALWQNYQFSGDLLTLAENYQGMRRYVSYLTRLSRGGILSHGLGDWADVGPNPPGSHHTPMGVTATATFLYDLRLMAEIAGLLGRDVEAEGFRGQAEDVRAAFNRRFFNPETNNYASGSQAANAMALFTGSVPEDRTSAVQANLVDDVVRRGYHTTAGDVGHRFVLQAVADAGRSDVVLNMMQQTDYPSYGHQLALGATALTEAWDGPARGWSQNHFMLGHAEEWFYRSLLGIDQAPGSAGWGRIVIRPALDCGLEWARGSYDSPRGRIAVSWKRHGREATVRVTVPPNARATVVLPGRPPRDVGAGSHVFVARQPERVRPPQS